MRKRLAIVFFGAASFAAACDIGNPGVRGGGSELEFGTLEEAPGLPGPQPVWRITRYLGSPFFQWNHRDWELIGPPLDSPPMPPFDLTSFPLDSPNGPIVRYASNNAFWTLMPGDDANNTPSRELWNQHETLLFARDPEEFYDLLYGLVGPTDFKNPMFLPKWRGE